MKILIVDDDSFRSSTLKRHLVNGDRISESDVVVVENAYDAIRFLQSNHVDVLFLDVVLPYRDEAPSHQQGFRLLNQVTTSKNISRPLRIVGITANVDELDEYKIEFEKSVNIVIDASERNGSWKSQCLDVVSYCCDSKTEQTLAEKDTLVITVHGIRTIGKWQTEFEAQVTKFVSNLESVPLKYGRFSAFSFFFPYFRNRLVEKFFEDFLTVLKENQGRRIFIFSHSNGTYFVADAINRAMKLGESFDIHTIVFAGSVLESDTRLSSISDFTGARIVNECGISDSVLLLSEAFVPGTGMAGRIGFHGFLSSKITNRYHKGGHSFYFKKKSEFYKKYWEPLLYSDEVTKVDERSEGGFFSRKLEAFCSMIRPLSYFNSLLVFLILVMVVTL